jgi:uroporphyrinogen-III synthase
MKRCWCTDWLCVSTAFVVVFFAPSSAELALPVLQKHFTVRSSRAQSDEAEQKPLVKVAAIGPTTARALADKHRIQVDVVSEKPEPSALAEAIHLLSSI